jgi:hypothetical protein
MAPIDIRKRVIAQWLTQVQGERTQADLAEDITRTTGWNLDRTRLGRYQNQRLPVGREVIEHLNQYAKAKGIAAPDFTPAPEPVVVDPVAAAIDRQTAVLAALVEELRAMQGVQRGNAKGVVSALADLAAEVRALPSARGTGSGAAGR